MSKCETLAFQMAASLVIFVGLGMPVGRTISRLVISLAIAMPRIGKSEFKTQVRGAKRGDEIGEIARILPQFRDGLAESEHNSRIALHKSTPFDGSSNTMMITERDFKVLFANEALMHLFEVKRQVFAEPWPGPERLRRRRVGSA